MMVNVTYDTDLDTVKQIVADIGRTLMEDPAFEPDIIEPLKLQGVENDDQAWRTARHPAQGLYDAEESVRRERHLVRVPDGQDRRRRTTGRRRAQRPGTGSKNKSHPPSSEQSEDGSRRLPSESTLREAWRAGCPSSISP